MAFELNAGKYVRRDLYLIDPNEILITEELRGRHKAPSEEDIVAMAVSLLDHGQQQPVACRRVDGKRVKLHAGFTRANAARLIRSGFTDDQGKHRQDAEFKLKCVIVECNDAEAFVANVVENAHRKNTSPIDDALNQRRLREQHGKEDAEIARLYRCSVGKVLGLRNLLDLDADIQDRVHNGEMTVEGALTVKKLPAKQRKEAVEKATTNGHVSTAAIKSQVREEHLRDADDKPAAPSEKSTEKSKTVSRTLKDVRDFFGDLANDADEKQAEFAKKLLTWIRGECTDKVLHNALDKLTGGAK